MNAISWLGIAFMRVLAPLPLRLIRGMGWLLGCVLYVFARSRRDIVRKNLQVCLHDMPKNDLKALEFQVFIYFAQAWLDRSWLWHGSPSTLMRRLKLTGDLETLRHSERLVMFVPHFFGLDAGALAITLPKIRDLCFIYTPQANAVIDHWMLLRRQRFGGLQPFIRGDGIHEIAAAIKSGVVLHLSPDMDFGRQHAEFVPFFGCPVATVTSLSRFARISRAKVITLTSILNPEGYEVRISAPWADFPTADAVADTTRMNHELEALIREMPAQYYWVHKRLKTRPSGDPPIYG